MRFYPSSTIGANQSEQKLWQALKTALEYEPGKAYFGFRPRRDDGRVIKESDVLIMHLEYGICVIECKDCQIYEIDNIDNDEWFMVKSWYAKSMQPLAQANAAMNAVRKEINCYVKEQKLNDSKPFDVYYSHFVALPYITRQQWQDEGLGGSPTLRGAIFFQEELTRESICSRLAAQKGWSSNNISHQDWSSIWNLCKRDNLRTAVAERTMESSGVVRLMNNIANKTIILDGLQQKIASEIPPGAQRLRGLAGTGKTILLAQRAALMHYEYPDWDIVFTFHTKSLHQQSRELIDLAYRKLLEGHGLTAKSPNWNKLKVVSAWGSKKGGGFYANLALKSQVEPKTFGDAQREIKQDKLKSKKYHREEFTYVCECLETDVVNFPQIYDAVIIEEGQDLPPSFYRLAYHSLREPKRLYWAYDEAQGLNCLTIPNSESIFGRNLETGELLVDLRGVHEGGAQKSYIMNICYRTPRLLLMVAHAINMGLFHSCGVLQGVTTKADWNRLGYEVLGDSDFSDRSVKEGKIVTITRLDENSPHEVDRTDIDYRDLADSLLEIKTFADDLSEIEWIANQVTKDINIREWNPSDILITGLSSGQNDLDYYKALKLALEQRGISGYLINNKGNDLVFRQNESVTISNIFRAKGNESWKVYACRFHHADFDWGQRSNLIRKRNEAFTAITRSKAWCVITGLQSPVFDELKQAKSQCPNFSFPAFNRKSLARVTNDY